MPLSVHARLSKRFDQLPPRRLVEALRQTARRSRPPMSTPAPPATLPRPGPAARRAGRRPARPADPGREGRPAAPVPGRRSPGSAWARSAPAPRPCTAWPGSARPPCSRRPSGLASTWDPELVRRVGAAVGDEVRGLHHKDPARRRPQRLGAGGQPAARPALGPQRGGLRRGPVADRGAWRRRTRAGCAATHPRTCGPRRPSSTSSATTTRPTAH